MPVQVVNMVYFSLFLKVCPKKNQCPGDAKWEIFSNFAKNGHGLYQLLAIAQVESWRLFFDLSRLRIKVAIMVESCRSRSGSYPKKRRQPGRTHKTHFSEFSVPYRKRMRKSFTESSAESGFVDPPSGQATSARYTCVERLSGNGLTRTASGVRYGKKYFLKALSDEAAKQSMYRQMLDKEFGMLIGLGHPGVVQAVEMAEIAPMGRCMVMEWIEGATLDRFLETHPRRNEAQRLVTQLLDAIEHIHRHGIAHRDLKPTNIMVTDNGGQVKIIDFGLADTDAHLNLKQPAGTAGFMAPEQLTGRDADTRNDIYSLGVILLGMNIGSRWKRVAKRCLLPINERWQSVEALRDALHRSDQRTKNMLRAFLATLFVVLVASMVAVASMALRSRRGNERLQAANDSLQSAIHRLKKEQTAQQLFIHNISDSMKVVNISNRELEQAEDARQTHEQRIDQAEQQGKQLVDKAMRNTRIMQHLDTLTNLQYLTPDYTEKCLAGLRAINKYVEGLDATFSESDRSHIYNLLTKYNAERWLDPIEIKYKQIPKQ